MLILDLFSFVSCFRMFGYSCPLFGKRDPQARSIVRGLVLYLFPSPVYSGVVTLALGNIAAIVLGHC